MLTGKYTAGAPFPPGSRMTHKRYSDRFYNDENFHIVEKLRAFCAARNRSLVELGLRLAVVKTLVGCVIAGASTPEQVHQNAAAIGWQLSDAEMAEVNRLSAKQKAA